MTDTPRTPRTPGTPRALRALPGPEPEQTRVKVREPSDLVVLVPYLLHFHPEESVVAVFFASPGGQSSADRAGTGRMVLTARFDLPTTVTAAPFLAREVDRVGRHAGADQVVLLGYSDDPDRRSSLEAMARSCRLDLLDALWISAGRWWSVICGVEECCPREGRAYDPRSHPMAAEAVLAGMSAVPTRAGVAALAAGPPPDRQRRLVKRAAVVEKNLTGTRRTRQRRMHRMVRAYLGRDALPTELEALTLAALATDVWVRDVAFAAMDRACADDHLRLWQAVVRQVPDQLAAAPLCLLGIAGWLDGNGTLLNACVDRLELIAPGYRMGEICADIARRAVPPGFWEEMGPAFAFALPC